MKSDSPTHMVFTRGSDSTTRGSGNLALALLGLKFWLVGLRVAKSSVTEMTDTTLYYCRKPDISLQKLFPKKKTFQVEQKVHPQNPVSPDRATATTRGSQRNPRNPIELGKRFLSS